MSRIVGDALVGGGLRESAVPEYVTVRITRGQAEALAESADHMRAFLEESGFNEDSRYIASVLSALRAQIGGAR